MTDGNRPAHPERDDDWNARARNETATERLDRNWGDLIQELRVLQTGVQFLTGFLLTLPFQQKCGQLSGAQVALYLCTVSASIGATAFLQAPVSVHRALFRRHRRRATVLLAHRLSIVGMILLACAVVGVASLIFDVLKGTGAGIAAAVGDPLPCLSCSGLSSRCRSDDQNPPRTNPTREPRPGANRHFPGHGHLALLERSTVQASNSQGACRAW